MPKDINQIAQVIKTGDGSSTLYIKEMDETYHSTNGAHQESVHIFINEGLKKIPSEEVKILEVGFGTGLNAILTLMNKEKSQIEYHTLEPFPIGEELIKDLNFKTFLKPNDYRLFQKLHQLSWDEFHQIQEFGFKKYKTTLQAYDAQEKFDLIYFDAFAPSKQADVWGLDNLKKCFKLLKKSGFLVTYCASGQFKRNLKLVGFDLEHPPGPKGKREITRAIKK